jgi:hypothetical protein
LFKPEFFLIIPRECTSREYEIREDGTEVEIGSQYVFLSNGCIKDDINTFYQNVTRIEWADETAPTFSKDQFKIVPRYDNVTSIKVSFCVNLDIVRFLGEILVRNGSLSTRRVFH